MKRIETVLQRGSTQSAPTFLPPPFHPSRAPRFHLGAAGRRAPFLTRARAARGFAGVPPQGGARVQAAQGRGRRRARERAPARRLQRQRRRRRADAAVARGAVRIAGAEEALTGLPWGRSFRGEYLVSTLRCFGNIFGEML
eukprot:1158342-Pleurochrysis_carterae.AAC.1